MIETRISSDSAPTTEWPPGLASIRQFAAAVKCQNGNLLCAIQKSFGEWKRHIENSYVTPGIDACALLVVSDKQRPRWRLTSSPRRRQVMVWIDRRDVVMREPRFAQALWRTLWLARRAEGASGAMISEQTRDLVVDMLYTVAVFLLGALDVAAKLVDDAQSCADAGSSAKSIRAKLEGAAAIANAELDEIEKYLQRAAIQKTFRQYLLGLPVGAALLALPIFVVVQLLPLTNQFTLLITISIVGGGLGAITSVMVRITRGQKLEVDIHHGRMVTFFAGMFRPLVGATFGVALYVLVIGGLLPLASDPQAVQAAHFFGGLSFLAGFSERWAQDTIVRSAPIAPSPATTVGAGHETAQSDDSGKSEKLIELVDEPPCTPGKTRKHTRISSILQRR